MLYKFRVSSAGRKQILVRSAFANLRVLDHENSVRLANGAQMMRDHDARPSFHQPVQRLHHRLLGRWIQSRGGFVENQDRRVADDRARNRDALPLPAGKRGAALAEHRRITLRQLLDEFVGVREPRRAGRFPSAGRRVFRTRCCPRRSRGTAASPAERS